MTGLTVALTALCVGLLGCTGTDDGEGDAQVEAPATAEAIDTYVSGVHAAYAQSLESATAMDEAINAFVADPTEEHLEAARDAWLVAREDYGPTEAFRFYDGPIDNVETGVEARMNAWPMDEAYVDYVEGDLSAGIINDPANSPRLDAETLAAANEAGGETNISTGWHAIEFLLWGQDLDDDGPGARPADDYATAANADRRSDYLTAVSALLVSDLADLVEAWEPGAENYRAEFVNLETDEALRKMVTGIGELSGGELAGERMNVAYAARSQEDEQSCFSDSTTSDIVANATGIRWVLEGTYPGIEGPGILDLLAEQDAELASELTDLVAQAVTSAESIPAPFDQHLADGVADDSPGRTQILETIVLLEDQAEMIGAAADALGASIQVS